MKLKIKALYLEAENQYHAKEYFKINIPFRMRRHL